MKKIKITIIISLIIILSLIFYNNFYGYENIEKQVNMDTLDVNIHVRYRNIDSRFIFVLDPDIKNKMELEYNVEINGVEKAGATSDFGKESIKIENVYIIKDFENDDFSSYVIGAKYFDNTYGIMIIKLTKYVFIKGSNQGYFYESWYDDLLSILNSNNLSYTGDELDSLFENKTWNEVFYSLPKREGLYYLFLDR